MGRNAGGRELLQRANSNRLLVRAPSDGSAPVSGPFIVAITFSEPVPGFESPRAAAHQSAERLQNN